MCVGYRKEYYCHKQLNEGGKLCDGQAMEIVVVECMLDVILPSEVYATFDRGPNEKYDMK